MNLYETRLKAVMDLLSNGEPVDIKDEWIEEAGEAFKAALKKQFSPPPNEGFRLRMSNIGRPLCQLQMEKAGASSERKPYNHVVRMAIGDAVECILGVLIRAANLPITGEKNKVEWQIAGTTIKGEDDLELDGKIYDIKSASPWSFDNKWSQGWEGLMEEDGFGYRAQLIGYSLSQNKDIGGWIVANKSTGEVAVVHASPSRSDVEEIAYDVKDKVKAIASDAPFSRCYEDEEETFRGKPTGNRRLGKECSFCQYKNACWPDAKYLPQAKSQAKNVKYFWYTQYQSQTNEGQNDDGI